MGSLKLFLLAGVASLATLSTASAADLFLPPPPPVEAPAQYAPVEFSGFYLRGDAGVGFEKLRGANSTFADGTYPGGFSYDGANVNDQGILDVGIGYQFNHYFRADLTGEYRAEANYSALRGYTNAFGNASCGANCYDSYHGKISSGVILANGYFDLGTWYGVTLFAGAGAGVSINKFANLTDVTVPYNGGAGATNFDASKTNFAYALMAGMSYAITPQMKLELSYRYLDQGTFRSGQIYCNTACNPETHSFKLASSDVRLGLRYMFADFAPVPQYAPQLPLVRKY